MYTICVVETFERELLLKNGNRRLKATSDLHQRRLGTKTGKKKTPKLAYIPVLRNDQLGCLDLRTSPYTENSN